MPKHHADKNRLTITHDGRSIGAGVQVRVMCASVCRAAYAPLG
jgi:hypothetical protein